MNAVFLYGKEDLRFQQEFPVPELNDDEILLKTKSSNICGTDLRMYSNGYKNITENNPLILGHEFSGLIEKTGKNVPDFYREGMRVAVAPNMGCGTCEMCVCGNNHLCNEYKAFGINIHGSFADYVRVPKAAIQQGNVIAIPDSMTFEEASLAEPLSCVLNTFERVDIKLGDDVLIMGAGSIGLMHAMMAKRGGAAKVILTDLSKERLDRANSMDADFITLPSENLKEEVMELTNGKGVDVCITANPSPEAQIQSLKLLVTNGRVSFFGGIPKGSDLSGFDTNLIHYKQLTVTGTTRQSLRQFRKTLRLIENNLIDAQKLISHTYFLKDLEKAIEMMKNSEGIKHAVMFD
ncbi:MAG: zinc-dependent dehydrogenase [Cyclobacteriaceae bacterium]|nr:zinc-dependent dehydrogenase [Cyclobacteriaceae bacterium]